MPRGAITYQETTKLSTVKINNALSEYFFFFF